MVAAMPYPSGQGTQALVGEMARGLSLRGHQVHLVCYHHQAFARTEPFTVHRIRPVPFYQRIRSGPDLVKPFLDLMLAQKAASVVRSHCCQLVHAHNYEGALAGCWAAKLNRVPLLYHAHNLMADELPRYFHSAPASKLAQTLGVGLDHFVPRLADAGIAIHQRLAAALSARGLAAHVVEPGIDTAFWAPAKNTDRRHPLMIYTGNLDAYQDLPILFRALQIVRNKMPAARLLIATPNEIQQARKMAVDHGVIDGCEFAFTSGAADTRKHLHRALLAVTPRSSWSGFPIKNLNAAAAGLPLVCCAGSAFGLEPGMTGLVVDNADPKALADAMIDLLQNPARARRMGQAGRRLAENKYSLAGSLDAIERAWLSCFTS